MMELDSCKSAPSPFGRGFESWCVNICTPCAHVRRTDLWSVATDQRSVLRIATDQRSVLRFGCGFAALG